MAELTGQLDHTGDYCTIPLSGRTTRPPTEDTTMNVTKQIDTESVAFVVAEALARTQPDDMPPGKQGDYQGEYYQMREALRMVRHYLQEAGVKVEY